MSRSRIRPPLFLPLLFAAAPSIAALTWFAFGDIAKLRDKAPIDPTPFFEMLTIFLAVLYGLGRSGFLQRPPRPILILLGILAVVICAGFVLNAPQPIEGLMELLLRLALVAFAVSIAFLCTRFDPRLWDRFTLAIFIMPLLHLPILVVLYVLYIDEPAMNWLTGPIGYEHVRIWGMILGVSLAVGVTRFQGPWMWIGAALIFTMLFWSGTRGAVLGFTLAYGLTLILFWTQMRGSLFPVIATVAVGASLSLIPRLPMISYGMIRAVEKSIDGSSDPTAGRLELWSNAWNWYIQNPIIGHGFDQFQYLNLDTTKPWLQPHNIVLQLLVDLGAIGALCVAAILLWYWLRATGMALADRARNRIAALTGINAIIAMSFLDGSLFHPELTILFAMCFGIAYATPRPMDRSPR